MINQKSWSILPFQSFPTLPNAAFRCEALMLYVVGNLSARPQIPSRSLKG
jgi:hypothetical protein